MNIGIMVPSRQSPDEFNFLLNPLFPNFTKYAKVKKVFPADFDSRLKERG